MNELFNFKQFLALVFTPVVDFLKKEGVWDELVIIYNILAGLSKAAFLWLNSAIVVGDVIQVVLAFLKFIVRLFIILFNVLIDIFTWIFNLFK
ncbi:MAG: hypothetical protein UV58_C0010G0042 [Candidatus Wolfebacteria bacterium GW2011_GWC1_43_10]|uniref:Uncharacterized protein n=1 Tax=Candidatus Wolfebacteria bacterium GW2011_GWC1_43_10 TaxID=1619011 RepID=A0A0G1CA43_9BACT|nr:MAG: hypothetical protein UV58_C0010G0042 [Candidatus Wolfebacteria bacterium GW2011_GWC1_43_10]KKT22200.1 MAG: hypothetical protein UW08_C0014G0010 [Parcubacteria group bacterium GW2011_GWB1_43_8b]KKT85820.1 MAG: hypothetical protein UW85_C0012G0010 [Parcubacteria group bacterium GW2011_GWA1_Parcubacteria_45_10]